MMLAGLRNAYDRLRGTGDYGLSIPALDGPYRPNAALDEADMWIEMLGADHITRAGGQIFFAAGGKIYRLDAGRQAVPWGEPGPDVTALAGDADGRLAIARSGASVELIGPKERHVFAETAGLGDTTSLCFLPDGRLALTVGAAGKAAREWRHDLMQLGRSGAVYTLAIGGALQQIASGLAWPAGVAAEPDGSLLVTTAWDHSLYRLQAPNPIRIVLKNLPGYPSRISPAATGGYWLTLFAPRNQLVEFVLREPLYRNRMVTEIAPDYWISPALHPAVSPLAVMMDGAQKIGGFIKPWAPSMSGAMVIRLGATLQPEFSLHSQASGQTHGVTSVLDTEGRAILFTSHGRGGVLHAQIGA